MRDLCTGTSNRTSPVIMNIKEIVIYGLVGVSSLTMLAYTVHMFVGGMVSEQTENLIMAGAVLVGAVILGLLAWDIVRRRRRYEAYVASSKDEDETHQS